MVHVLGGRGALAQGIPYRNRCREFSFCPRSPDGSSSAAHLAYFYKPCRVGPDRSGSAAKGFLIFSFLQAQACFGIPVVVDLAGVEQAASHLQQPVEVRGVFKLCLAYPAVAGNPEPERQLQVCTVFKMCLADPVVLGNLKKPPVRSLVVSKVSALTGEDVHSNCRRRAGLGWI
eukprot:1142638-Pelagomonas_calceolata.AAC.4